MLRSVMIVLGLAVLPVVRRALADDEVAIGNVREIDVGVAEPAAFSGQGGVPAAEGLERIDKGCDDARAGLAVAVHVDA